MYNHILVPTDGSPLSLKAAKAAARLAKSQKAKITAYYAIPPFSLPVTGEALILAPEQFSEAEYGKRMKEIAAQALEKVEAEAKKQGVEFEGTSATAESPWKGIIGAAKAADCDLIVMASHGRSGLEGLLLGSETMKVLTHSKTPVLVCR